MLWCILHCVIVVLIYSKRCLKMTWNRRFCYNYSAFALLYHTSSGVVIFTFVPDPDKQLNVEDSFVNLGWRSCRSGGHQAETHTSSLNRWEERYGDKRLLKWCMSWSSSLIDFRTAFAFYNTDANLPFLYIQQSDVHLSILPEWATDDIDELINQFRF